MNIALTILQGVCAVGAAVLDRLSHRSAGVNHHVVFRRQQYLQTVLSADHVRIYALVLSAVLLVLAAALIRGLRRGQPARVLRALGGLAVFTAALLAELLVPAAAAIPIYIYLLGLTLAIWALQALKLAWLYRRREH
jgi:hypothetical protein